MLTEIWKDIPDFEGLYQASNLGRIKSLLKIRYTGKGYRIIREYPERIIKPTNTRNGYLLCVLQKYGETNYRTVHRLVALTFLNNPNNYECVNHIDLNKHNNIVENLEWCSYSQNAIHAYENGRQPGSFGIRKYGFKKLIDLDTSKIYQSITSYYKSLHPKPFSYVYLCHIIKSGKQNQFGINVKFITE